MNKNSIYNFHFSFWICIYLINLILQCPVYCTKVGSILRNGRGRVVTMTTDGSRQVLAVHSNNDSVELFQFLSETEAETRFKKRLRKVKNKAAK